MLIVAAVIVAAVLVLVTALQTTYPEKRLVQSRSFKVAAVSIALLSAILMIVGGILDERSKAAEERAQAELRQATEGLSRTVFPQDMHFEIDAVGPTDTSGVLFVNVLVVPDDSTYFCKWPVTHTPNLSGQGQIFRATELPRSKELYKVMLAQGVQALLFKDFRESGSAEQAHRLEQPTGVDNSRRRTLEEYEKSYFVLDITGGPVSDVRSADLVLKGWRVPFIVQKAGDNGLASRSSVRLGNKGATTVPFDAWAEEERPSHEVAPFWTTLGSAPEPVTVPALYGGA
jgi:hypothetical protein